MDDVNFSFKQEISMANLESKEDEVPFENDEKRINLDEKFGDYKDSGELVESQFQEIQEKFSSDEADKHIPVLSVDPLLCENPDFEYTSSENASPKTLETGSLTSNNADEPQRGRVEVIRLQAVSNNKPQSLENSSYVTDISTSEGMTNKVFINENMDIITNPSIVSSQGQYQMLESNVTSKEIPMYVTPGLQTDLQSTDLLQRAVSTISSDINTSYQQIMLNVPAPEFNMLRSDKTLAIKRDSWTTSSSSNIDTSDCSSARNALFQTSSSQISGVSNEFANLGNVSDIPSAQAMQRYITSDNQVVYGYKDANGEMHFFNPAINDRESHNEKERKRRSRVSEACGALRRMIPGINEKTDKATVFEQTAKYLKFLREKFGTQFDQAYCEKFYQERNRGTS